MSLAKSLSAHLNKFEAAPFLFIGSGFSRRYLNAEMWEDLLRKFSAQTDKPFEYFRSSAGNDYPLIGTKIAKAFHEIWWREPQYQASRAKYADDAISEDSALKIEISKYLTEISSNVPTDPALTDELLKLQGAVIDGIITTNWDLLLESLFPDFKSFIGQDELLFSAPLGVGEIYKIHGCCSRPNTLTLTRGDYDRFSERNPYLAAKLLATFVEHPIIFLGYSLSDSNVGQILKSIASCLTNQNLTQLQDRLIFIEWRTGAEDLPLSQTSRIIDNHSIPLCAASVDSFMSIFEVLSSSRRKFPARLLRQLKEHVYELVLTSDPSDRIFVQDIDEDSDLSDLDVVFGVGTGKEVQEIQKSGYVGLKRKDLLSDILDDSRHFDPSIVVDQVLPALLRGTLFLPIFKYLRGAGRLGIDGALIGDPVDAKVKKLAEKPFDSFGPPKYYLKKRESINLQYGSFQKLVEIASPEDVLFFGLLIQSINTEVSTLENFLSSNRHFLESDHSIYETQFIKMVCALDYLKFKTQIN